MSHPIYGRILNYRIGIRKQISHECLFQFVDIVSAGRSGQLIGKVVWKGENRDITGKSLVSKERMVSLGSNSKKDCMGKR